MTGMNACVSSDRSRLTISKPSIVGMMISTIARSGSCARASLSPSSPSPAVTTVCPAYPSSVWRNSRSFGRSSTTRILAITRLDEQLVDFVQQLARIDRPREELRGAERDAVRLVEVVPIRRREEDERDRAQSLTLLDRADQFESAGFRHVHVADDKIGHIRFSSAECFGDRTRAYDAMPRWLERRFDQRDVRRHVVNDENHAPRGLCRRDV